MINFLHAVEILGPIRTYYHKGGTLGQMEILGWHLDGKQSTSKEIIRAAEDQIRLCGASSES